MSGFSIHLSSDEAERFEAFYAAIREEGYVISKNELICTAINKYIDKVTDGGDAVFDVEEKV